MKNRVSEICKERGISMSDLAGRMGVKQANLSQSLRHNPTLSTLQSIAENLGVGIQELFVREENRLSGYVEAGGKITKVCSRADLLPFVGTFGIKAYSNYRICKKDLSAFIRRSLGQDRMSSFSAILDGEHIVSLVSAPEEDDTRFYLTVFTEGQEAFNEAFCALEYSDGEGNTDIDDLIHGIWVETIGGLDPAREYDDDEYIRMEVYEE